jgi:hypothetical protein
VPAVYTVVVVVNVVVVVLLLCCCTVVIRCCSVLNDGGENLSKSKFSLNYISLQTDLKQKKKSGMLLTWREPVLCVYTAAYTPEPVPSLTKAAGVTRPVRSLRLLPLKYKHRSLLLKITSMKDNYTISYLSERKERMCYLCTFY